MKLMLISQFPPPSGGIATWSKAYLDYMSKKENVEISCVNCALKGERANNFNAKRNFITEIKRAISIVKDTYQKAKDNIDIVHLNSSCSGFGIIRDWLCVQVIRKNIPIVLHCHCTVQDQLGDSTISKWMFKKVAKRAKKIIVLNELSRAWVWRETGYSAIVIPNFIDEQFVAVSKKKRTVEIKEVFFAGHLLESKGIKEMITVAENNPDVHFTFAGVYTKEMKRILDKDNITLLGDVDHKTVLDNLDKSDLYLFLSHTEGFSISLLEAMARGIPSLVSNVGANADMVKDCGGIVVDAKDSKAAMDEFKSVRHLTAENYDAIARAEIKKVKMCYTTNVVLDELMNLYRGMQDGK